MVAEAEECMSHRAAREEVIHHRSCPAADAMAPEKSVRFTALAIACRPASLGGCGNPHRRREDIWLDDWDHEWRILIDQPSQPSVPLRMMRSTCSRAAFSLRRPNGLLLHTESGSTKELDTFFVCARNQRSDGAYSTDRQQGAPLRS